MPTPTGFHMTPTRWQTTRRPCRAHGGDRFGGSPELDNIAAQLQDVNLSKYKKLENIWAKALENGEKVSVDVRTTTDPATGRPVKFEIDYSIDGVKQPQSILYN